MPPKSKLELIARRIIAKEIVPTRVSELSAYIGERGEFGRLLFAQLVLVVVHETASIYKKQRDRLVLSIIDKLESLTNQIHDTLESLNLPEALYALQALVSLNTEDIQRANTLSRLQKFFADVAKLKSKDEAIFSKGNEILKRYKVRASLDLNVKANKLCTQAAEIRVYLKDATDCNKLIKENILKLLASSDITVNEVVLNLLHEKILARLEAKATKLQIHLNKLIDIESRQRKAIEKIREELKKDDFNSAILVEVARFARAHLGTEITSAPIKEFFKQRLTQYVLDGGDVKAKALKQDKSLKRLKGVNLAFVATKKDYTSSREQAR